MSGLLIPNSYQKPNYYTDELCRLLTGDEWKILDVIIRKTYGWDKTEDRISIPQMVRYCGISEATARASINSLVRFGVIHRKENIGQPATYGPNREHGKIDLPGLIERQKQTNETDHKRVAKAWLSNRKMTTTRSVPQNGSTPQPVLSHRTGSGGYPFCPTEPLPVLSHRTPTRSVPQNPQNPIKPKRGEGGELQPGSDAKAAASPLEEKRPEPIRTDQDRSSHPSSVSESVDPVILACRAACRTYAPESRAIGDLIGWARRTGQTPENLKRLSLSFREDHEGMRDPWPAPSQLMRLWDLEQAEKAELAAKRAQWEKNRIEQEEAERRMAAQAAADLEKRRPRLLAEKAAKEEAEKAAKAAELKEKLDGQIETLTRMLTAIDGDLGMLKEFEGRTVPIEWDRWKPLHRAIAVQYLEVTSSQPVARN